MSGVDRALSFKNSEVRSAILKMFQWLDDQKNSGLRDVRQCIVFELCKDIFYKLLFMCIEL